MQSEVILSRFVSQILGRFAGVDDDSAGTNPVRVRFWPASCPAPASGAGLWVWD